jgi:hypothetical protein
MAGEASALGITAVRARPSAEKLAAPTAIVRRNAGRVRPGTSAS